MKSLRIFAILCLLLTGCSLHSQLVNIESKRMQTDSTRFVLSSDLLFSYTNNNGEYIFQINSNASVQFKSRDLRSIYFMVGNYNLIRSRDEDFQNAYFVHARFNRKLTDVTRLEAFVQTQYNERLTISYRSLFGMGLRFKFIDTDLTRAYFGNAYMYEIESLEASGDKRYNHRNSSYLSVNRRFDKINMDITATVYFQPLYRKIADHRILGQFKAEIPLSERLSFSALYNYSVIKFDSMLDDDRSSNINFGFTLNL